MTNWLDIPWSRLGGFIPSISFLWPSFLWLLLLVPLLIAAYVLLLRRRRRNAVHYPNLALIRDAAPGMSWRRHVPVALMLTAFAFLLLAIARRPPRSGCRRASRP